MRISASYSKKVQLQQYEPIEISCFVETDADKIVIGKSTEEKYNQLFNFCKAQVEKRIEAELNPPIVDNTEIKHKTSLEAAQDIGNEDIGN